ncbi:UNVERIFIED_ORG: carbamoyl-phosphate synthase large subunit [Bacillus cereus]
MKRILIIGNFAFGKNYLRHAKRLNFEVILATHELQNELDKEESKLLDYYVHVDILNVQKTVDKLVQLYTKIPFDGVLAGHVFLPEIANRVAETLGLPCISDFAIEHTMNKLNNRKLLKEAGLFNYQFFEIKSYEDLLNHKNQIKFPCIIKPINGFGSINVRKIYSFSDLEKEYQENLANNDYANLGNIFSNVMLIEEYIEGKEYSVESVIENGKVNILMITEKVFHHKFTNVELGHILPARDLTEDIISKIKLYVTKIHQALQVKTGITHAEIKVNNGNIALIELNPRIGGGCIPDMLGKVLGIDMYELIIENSMGSKMDNIPKPNGSAFIKFVHAPFDGIFKNIENVELVENDPNFVRLEYKTKLGDKVKKLKDNRGRLILFAFYSPKGYEDVKESVAKMESCIKVSLE